MSDKPKTTITVDDFDGRYVVKTGNLVTTFRTLSAAAEHFGLWHQEVLRMQAEVGRLTCEVGGHQDTIRELRAEVDRLTKERETSKAERQAMAAAYLANHEKRINAAFNQEPTATPPANPQPERCPRCGGEGRQGWCGYCNLVVPLWPEWTKLAESKKILEAVRAVAGGKP